MARDISSPMLTAVTSALIRPAFLVDIQFRSELVHVWTGAGSLTWSGNTYQGVGSLGKVGNISEGTSPSADGTTISLSGIDPVLLPECLTDIQLGAPVTIWFALFDASGSVLGSPYPLFVGTVDQPILQIGVDELTISLKLENRLVNLQRSNNRRYTSADQQLYYPGDSSMNWVEILNDQALLWKA